MMLGKHASGHNVCMCGTTFISDVDSRKEIISKSEDSAENSCLS